MKKKIFLSLVGTSLLGLGIYYLGKPDYRNPADEVGTLYLVGNDFYLNGFELERLTKEQRVRLFELLDQPIRVIGFFEKSFLGSKIEEIHVTQIMPL